MSAVRVGRLGSTSAQNALREHDGRLDVPALEERDREGYARKPPATDKALLWEQEAQWPVEQGQ